MRKTRSHLMLAMAVALPLSLEAVGTVAADELDPPLPPAPPAESPLDATFPLFIESGSGEAFVDAEGRTWSADVGFIGGSTIDRGDIEITGTTADRVYQTERWGAAGYLIKVPNGVYSVGLHFAETFHDVPGKRLFSVDVEGQAVNDLDVFAEAGGKNAALIKTFDNVVVTDGELNIELRGDASIINGVTVAAVPPVLALEGAAVAENATPGTSVGTVTAVSAGDPAVIYDLVESADGRFVIDPKSGQLSVAADAVLDYESHVSHDIVVAATDDRGARAESAFTIEVIDVPEPKAKLRFITVLPENAPAGTQVGVVNAVTPEGPADVTFGLSDDAAGRFTIDATNGRVRVAEGAVLDYEAAVRHRITAVASDGAEQAFVVALEDVNEPLSDVLLSAQSVEAHAPAGTVIGVASAVDPDRADTYTFSLLKDGDKRFAIDADSGVLSVAENADLDPETAANHRIVIEATDSAGHKHREGFTLAVEASAATLQPVLIQAGSASEHIDAAGRRWLADTGFVDGQIVDRGAAEIAATDNDRIYQTERWGVSAYQLPLADRKSTRLNSSH